MFDDPVKPDCIKQGQLGDCYFLSSLSVMAEKPSRVVNMFLTKEPNKEGLYAV